MLAGVKVSMIIDGIYAWVLLFLVFSMLSGGPIYIVTYRRLKQRYASVTFAVVLSIISSYLPISVLLVGLLAAKSYTSFEGVYFWGTLGALVMVGITMRVCFDLWSGASNDIPLYSQGKP